MKDRTEEQLSDAYTESIIVTPSEITIRSSVQSTSPFHYYYQLTHSSSNSSSTILDNPLPIIHPLLALLHLPPIPSHHPQTRPNNPLHRPYPLPTLLYHRHKHTPSTIPVPSQLRRPFYTSFQPYPNLILPPNPFIPFSPSLSKGSIP